MTASRPNSSSSAAQAMSTLLSVARTLSGDSADGASLGDMLAEVVPRHVATLVDCLCTTSSPAIHSTDASRRALTHHELHAFVANFVLPSSASTARLGPNDRVMLALPTGPENAVALVALATYHTCAPVNASCTAAELLEDAARLNAKAVVTTRDAAERLQMDVLARKLGCIVVFVEPRTTGPAGLFDFSLMSDASSTSSAPFAASDTHNSPSLRHGLDDLSLVLHTSGTSGKKKVVPYTLRSLIIGTFAVIKSWDLGAEDVNMNMMPLFHVGGIVRNLFAPLMSGGSAIVCTAFDPLAWWKLAVDLKATWYYAAPTMHHAILSSQPDTISPSELRIRMICNAAGGLLPSLAAQLKETFGGATVLPSYGMTECMPIASPPTSYQLDRPGCSGIACGPHLSIRMPGNIEQELAQGKTGAICVRGFPTFEGYEVSPDRNVPLDTSAFTSEGWFDSGDMGYMDADGYLFINGRSKEIINKGGEVISPFEIEEAVMTVAKHRVKTTLAFAIDHDVMQETIGLVIVPVAGEQRIGLAELQDLLKDQLHPSKWPFALVYANDLPKNAAGKPLRIKLAGRLGLGCMNDNIPALKRHFVAETSPEQTSLSDPIPCSAVAVSEAAIVQVARKIPGVEEVIAFPSVHDGLPELFVCVQYQSGVDAATIRVVLAYSLPGYSVPDLLHVLDRPFPRTSAGNVDFDLIRVVIQRETASAMSETELAVRNIFADLLLVDRAVITPDSDFFLLGGNSLLLGVLSYNIRKHFGQAVAVPALFTNSTVRGVASLISEVSTPNSASTSMFDLTLPYDENPEARRRQLGSRSQMHPLVLFVQSLPFVVFYPMKAAIVWAFLLFILSYFHGFISGSYWERMGALLVGIIAGRLASRIVAPVAAIIFKWLVIGRYRPGTYQFWSVYHLRWWLVNQSLRAAGRGVFGLHPSLEILYYRLLGARIGKDVVIDSSARLAEFDLLTFRDGCRVDSALIRGFRVERDGFFTLDNIVIGRDAVINTYTQISPGAYIADGTVYGPHASSHDPPSPDSFAAYNRSTPRKPHLALLVLFAWPLIFLVKFVTYLPWFCVLWVMIRDTDVVAPGYTNLEQVIWWFADPERVTYHAVSRIARAVATPLLQLVLGIIVKRSMGLAREGQAADITQWVLLRRYINQSLVSQSDLKRAFGILGTHYEMTSVVMRALGAKVGRHVYWPGSGIYCPDPELLEVGDDVVFGSRSELFTTDSVGSGRITIGAGAMIADRVVLLPGTTVGRLAVLGSGTLGRRNGTYGDGSTWLGSNKGEAVCLNPGSKEASHSDTTTPFARAFYQRKTDYFVFPYTLLVLVNVLMAAISAAYWSASPVAAAQLLRQLHIHARPYHLFAGHWYQFGILYGLIASSFIVTLTLQGWAAMLWVIATKWIVIGRRQPGPCAWDNSSYCQRWQLHLTLSRVLYKGHGNGGVLGTLAGTPYIVMFYRALGAKIGKNCALFAGGKVGLLTEPDLVEIGDNCAFDDCSVVAHINSRGKFALNRLKIGNGCALRSGSRLLSGASMEDSSMLCEHTLLTSGEIAHAGAVYVGWPASEYVGRTATHSQASSFVKPHKLR